MKPTTVSSIPSTVVGVTASVAAVTLWPHAALAQSVTLDGSLGSGQLIRQGTTTIVPQLVGQTAGINLFHSFGQLSLSQPERLQFTLNSGSTVQNIISRVTGGNPSQINGTIQAPTNVNLFLINPSGIIFGRNARLNVTGSFVASTASGLEFGDLGRFTVQDSKAPTALLTVRPTALLYNQLGQQPVQSIQVNSRRTVLEMSPLLRIPLPTLTGLQVGQGRSLLLAGGAVNLNGGVLRAGGGHIGLTGLTGSGRLPLLWSNDVPRLATPNGLPADITFATGNTALEGARLSVQGNRSARVTPDIWVEGRNVTGDRPQIWTDSGTHNSGNVFLNARDVFQFDNADFKTIGGSTTSGTNARSGDVVLRARLLQLNNTTIQANTNSAGNGGNITLRADDRLLLSDRTALNNSSNNAGTGDAGNMLLYAGRAIELRDTNLTSVANQVASVGQQAGSGGNIRLETPGTVSIVGQPGSGFGVINVQTDGAGNAGGIAIWADRSVLIDGARLSTAATATGIALGNPGEIQITTGQFTLTNGANLTLTTNLGQGGNLRLRADTAQLQGNSTISVSNDGAGSAGNVLLHARDLFLGDRSQITARTTQGSGGNLILTIANRLQLQNGSSLSANNEGTGSAGNVRVQSGELFLGDRSQITARAIQGNGGHLNLNIARTLNLSGDSRIAASNEGIGSAGNVRLRAGSAMLDNRSQITARAIRGNGGSINLVIDRLLNLQGSSSISASNEGTGFAGNIRLQAEDVSLGDRSQIAASAARGNGGNIDLNVDNGMALQTGSSISVNNDGAGTAGNAFLQTRNLFLGNGSQITARAAQGDGGNLNLNIDNLSELQRGSSISVNNEGDGPAGNILLRARNLTLGDRSQITARAAQGNGGNINLDIDNLLELQQGSGIITDAIVNRRLATLATTAASRAQTVRSAGNIAVQAAHVEVRDRSQISARAPQGNGGNITMGIQDFLFLRQTSAILADATTADSRATGNGGNITIQPRTGVNSAPAFIVADGNANNNIVARANQGSGGNITLNSSGIFGFEQGRSGSGGSTNVIDASSDAGPQGTVRILNPDADPSRGLTELPADVTDTANQIARTCPTPGTAARSSAFTVSGRGGLPVSPTDPLTASAGAANWVGLDTPEASGQSMTGSSRNLTPPDTQAATIPVEAQGWVRAADGRVRLVAPGGGGMAVANCSTQTQSLPLQ